MKLVGLLAFASTIAVAFGNNDPAGNTEMDIAIFYDNKTLFRGFNIGLGAEQKINTETARFGFDFGLKTTIVGSKDKTHWGIFCNETEDNSCRTTSNDQYPVSYSGIHLNAQHADIYLRPIPTIDIDVVNPVVEKLPIDLVIGGDRWPFEDWGILGLAPNGSFAKYLTSLYGSKADVLFKFKLREATHLRTGTEFHLEAFINPVIDPRFVVKDITLEADAQTWSFLAGVYYDEEKLGLESAKTCLNTEEVILQANDYADRCDNARKQVCNGKTGKDCKKSNADFSQGKSLIIEIGGTKLEFAPEEYLYLDNENVECRFGPIADLNSSQTCEADAKFAVGKYFLSKYLPILKFRHDAPSSITLVKRFDIPSRSFWNNKSMWLAIITGAFAATFLVFMIVEFKKPTLDDSQASLAEKNEPLITAQ